MRHDRLQSAARLVEVRTDPGDERSTGDQGVGQTERLLRTMVLEHLLEHAIRRGFCVLQACHSAFLGTCRVPLVLEEDVPGTPHHTPGHWALGRTRERRGVPADVTVCLRMWPPRRR